jgi:uncharacterized protein YbjT (DUF2867 family)
MPVIGDVCDPQVYANAARGYDTLVHLVGVPNPSPAKATQFKRVDLASARAAAYAAGDAEVQHVVYVSVAHPAPVMRAYIEVRRVAEEILAGTGIPVTVLRPWYVLGPGHRWPYFLIPVYKVLGLFPSMRESTQRLGLITIEEMLRTLVHAVEYPASRFKVVEVPGIREIAEGKG